MKQMELRKHMEQKEQTEGTEQTEQTERAEQTEQTKQTERTEASENQWKFPASLPSVRKHLKNRETLYRTCYR